MAVHKYFFKNNHKNQGERQGLRRAYLATNNYPNKKHLSRLAWTTIVMSVSLVLGLSGAAILYFVFPHKPSLNDDRYLDNTIFREPPNSIDLSPDSVDLNITSRLESREGINPNWVYNVTNPTHFNPNDNLQKIVNEVVYTARMRGLPTNSLSIHLIDLNQQTEGTYQADVFRYPASIPKLFWLVAYYSLQAERNIPPQPIDLPQMGCVTTICKLIQKSDNEAASRIVDFITDTTSISHTEDYQTWLNKRYSVNYFFQKSGYSGINISQKNFPIPYLGMNYPQGWDLRMRGDNQPPIRNQMTARHASRLMYEIATYQAVSQTTSMQIMSLLKIDLNPQVWKPEEYDSVDGFLGKGIYQNRQKIDFYSKVGWTNDSRLEVALIHHRSKNRAYIISVFGDGAAYGEDWEFFPIISRLVYERMFE